MTMNADRYYRPAGAVPFTGTLLMLGSGTFAAVVLSFIYSLIDRYNPFIYLTFLATLGFGVGIGLAVHWGAVRGKVRNRAFVHLVGFVMGLIGLYFSWVWFVLIFSDWMFLTFDPVVFAFLIPELAREGVWEIRGATPTGWVLYAIWLAEAAAILIPAVRVAAGDLKPYCEGCGSWTKNVDQTALLKTADRDGLRHQLEEGHYEVLDELSAAGVDPSNHFQASVFACPRCSESSYLTVSHVTVTQKGDETRVDTDPFVKHLWVPHEVVEQVQRLHLQREQAPTRPVDQAAAGEATEPGAEPLESSASE